MRIGLNAGHTISGPGSGAIGFLNESQETRKIYEVVSDLLQQAGHKVVNCTVDRAGSQAACLSQITQLSNRQDLDWFVSIHLNAGGGVGTECYTYQGRQYEDAVQICRNMELLGFRNRGVKSGSGLYVIKKTKAKAILIEVCFVDNFEDSNRYRSIGLDRIGRAIAGGLAGCMEPLPSVDIDIPVINDVPKKTYVKVTYSGKDGLAVRKVPDWNAKPASFVRKNEVFTVMEQVSVGNGSMYRLKSGLYITAAEKYVTTYQK